MATISASIQLYDRVSSPIQGMISAVDSLCSAFNDVDSAMDRGFNADAINQARTAIDQASQEFNEVADEINNASNNQRGFNQQVQNGNSQTSSLVKTVGRLVATYASIQTVGKIINLSDELTQTTARLNLMNDGLQTTEELSGMIFQAAQNARGAYSEMASVVARFGNNAKDAFSSNAEVVEFAEIIQKQMTIAGAGTNEANAAMLQLSQALGSGVLRGDELNSIFEQAPNLIQSIADYMNVPIGKIREMAKDGELTADIVRSAVFASADDVNAKFNDMPKTWGQVWTSFKNNALKAFTPVLNKINDLANSPEFQSFVSSATDSLYTLSNIIISTFDTIGGVASFIYSNWSTIAPLIMGVIAIWGTYNTVLGVYNTIQTISNGLAAISAARSALKAGLTLAEAAATTTATGAQVGLNAALLACPLTWIIALIIALIAVVIAVANHFSGAGHVAQSAFGAICGGVMVVIGFFKNLGLSIANIALGIGQAIGAVASNIITAFKNAIADVQSFWYNLLSTALTVVEGICAALNKLPFIEFDYSGVSNKAQEYANKAQDAAGNKGEYKNIGDAFNKGMSTFETWKDGWVGEEYKKGAAWGDGVTEKASKLLKSTNKAKDTNSAYDTQSGIENSLNAISNDASSTADNTGKIANSVDISNENLKYLRDLAEQEAINRFTTAEVKVEMTNNNNVSGDTDIDGMITNLANGVSEALEIAAEGVHK